jgi:predicted nucleic acid-binding protein
MLAETQIDTIISPLAGAIAGGAIAVLAGAFTNYFNFRLNQGGDRLKSLNLALYHLLQVHRYAEFKLQGDPEFVFEEYIRSLCQEHGVSSDEFDRVHKANSHVKPLIQQRYDSELEDLNPESLKGELLSAVSALAKVEPELAHIIAIRSSWQKSLDYSTEYTEAVLSSLVVGELERSALRKFAENQKINQKEEILKDLRKDLLSVAKAIGWRKYLKIRRYIARMKRHLSMESQIRLIAEDAKSGVEETIQELVQLAEQGAKKDSKETMRDA